MAQYEEDAGNTNRFDKDGQPVRLANFNARITEELKYIDGKKSQTFYRVVGWQEKEKQPGEEEPERIILPEVTVPAKDFAAMGWVQQEWGIQAIVFPGSNVGAELSTAIRIFSKDTVIRRTIYTHTGWVQDEAGKEIWLAANGCITKKGLNDNCQVELPGELAKYQFPHKTANETQAVQASLELAMLGPPQILWPLLGGLYRSVIGPSDFTLHVTGRTGTYKSEIASLLQSHFGQEMDARHLPGSWSSTANALEALAYRAKDALMVIDDFIPLGTSWQRQQYQKTADQLIRGQGNQAGRARLTDTSSLQSTMYPRGLLLSTGEDTPEGHSVRGRMLIVELSPGDVDRGKLTTAQTQRELYPHALASFIAWLASDRKTKYASTLITAKEVRDQNIDVGHSRTPDMLGQLIAGIGQFLEFAVEEGHVAIERASQLWEEATAAILEAGNNQDQYLAAADPSEMFLQTLRALIQSDKVHLRTKDGGIPRKPTSLGWTEQQGQGDLPTYKANGLKIGWVDWDSDEMLLDQNLAYETIKKHSRGGITLTKQTLYKRLREAEVIKKYEMQRGRSTIRTTCEGASKQVLCLSLSEVLETQEKV